MSWGAAWTGIRCCTYWPSARRDAGALQGPGGRHGHEQPGARACLRRTRHRVSARASRGSLRTRHAARGGGHSGGRNLGTYPVSGQDHDGGWPDQRLAGARRDEEHGSGARRTVRAHAQIPASAVERARGAPLRSDDGRRACSTWSVPSSANSTVADGSCCAPPAPNRSSASWSKGTMPSLVKAGARDIAAAVEAAARAAAAPGAARIATHCVRMSIGRLAVTVHAANLRRLSSGAVSPRWWLCVVRWSQVIGKCMDRGPPTRRCSPDLEQRLKPEWQVDVVVFPPYVYLADAVRMLEESGIAVGAQDVCAEPAGAFTGQVAASMLKDVGCRYVIVGHSERRRLYHEDDVLVARKFAAVSAGRPHAGAVRGRDAGGARGAIARKRWSRGNSTR